MTPLRRSTPNTTPTPEPTGMQRLVRFLAVFAVSIGLLGFMVGDPALAQDDPADQVRIIEVDGLIDPVLTEFLLDELDRAEADNILAVVWQMNSEGTVIDQKDLVELVSRYRESDVQFVVWVGPAGSAALGGSAEIAVSADLLGVAAGSRIGETGPRRLSAAEFGPGFGDLAERVETVPISAGEAVDVGLAVGPVESVSVLGEFLTQIDGYQTLQCAGTDADPVACDGSSGVVAATQNRFVSLPLVDQMFHTVGSPEVAYLMFVGGLALLVFELYTAGIGIAGLIGAVFLALGCYGLGVLPTRPAGVALLLLAFVAMSVDIQTNVPRYYTVVGLILFALGTWVIWDGVTMSWVTGVAGFIGAVLFVYAGMPSMVRTRFSSPVIGRSWMIGEMGEALTELNPNGTIEIGNAPWRAMTNRATPIQPGDAVRVIGIEKLVLEVEPEEGAARDYRDRASGTA